MAAGGSGRFPSFDPEGTQKWTIYYQKFMFYCETRNIVDDAMRKAELVALSSDTMFEFMESVCRRNLSDENLSFTGICTAIEGHLSPKPNEIAASAAFYQRNQLPQESVTEYVTEIRKLAKPANFGEFHDRAVRDRLVVGLANSEVRALLLRTEELTLEKAIETARSIEMSQRQSHEVQQNGAVHRVAVTPSDSQPSKRVDVSGDPKCPRCSGSHDADKCRHKKTVCNYCSIVGHLERACRRKAKDESAKQRQASGKKPAGNNNNRKNLGALSYADRPSTSKQLPTSQGSQPQVLQNSYYEQQYHQEYSLGCLHSNQGSQQSAKVSKLVIPPPKMLQATVDGKSLLLEVDSGSPVALISEVTYGQNWPERPALQNASIDLEMWEKTPVEILGWFGVMADTPNGRQQLPIYVGAGRGCSLLGRQWFEPFNIRMEVPGCCHKLSAQPASKLLENLKSFECFKPGLGEYRGKPISFKPDPTVRPVFCKARKVPFARKTIISEEIDRKLQEGVWKGPLTSAEWATGIVPVFKPGSRPRLCGDYRITVNNAIKPDKYPMPTIEDAFSSLSGGKFFSKIDLTQAYTRLPVDEESAKLLTVNTHRGLFSVHRLPFGVSSAPGIFQRLMCDLLAGIEGVVVWLDDILVTGATRDEHDQRLLEVVKRLSEVGLRANLEKCEFLKQNLNYLGWHLDETGRKPLRDRVSAILDAPAPMDLGQLQSFIGKLTFYDSFLPNRAAVLEPLYRLSDKGRPWVWGEKEQQAFDEAKKMLASDDLLVHYDLDKEVVLSCDASPVGLGAVMAHLFPDNKERPVEYASRALEPAEKNYSQLDKEALGIIFAVKKFHCYIAGRSVIIYTDHKPLLGIFGRNKTPKVMSPRMERWLVILGCYDYDLRFRPGKQNGNSDALSRLIVPESTPRPVPEPHGLFLMTGINSPHLTWEQVAEHTANDTELQRVLQWTREGWPRQDPGGQLSPYFRRRDALSLSRGCLMWGVRVVIPPSLRSRALRHLHAAHLGIVKSKALARVLLWWPGLSGQIEEMVAKCPACQATRANAPSLPSTPWPSPEGPWQRLHIDFAGPFHGRHFVILVDAYSGWIDVAEVPGPTAEAAMLFLQNSFRYNGLPYTLVSDNGTAFRSKKFSEFCTFRGIRQLFSAPRHPQSNGRAERAVRSIKEKLEQVFGENWEQKLDTILDSLRSTPGNDGKSPNDLLMGREIRTILSLVRPKPVTVDQRLMSNLPYATGDSVWYKKFGCETWLPARVVELQGNRMARLDVEATRHFDQLRHRAEGAGDKAVGPGIILEIPQASSATPLLEQHVPDPQAVPPVHGNNGAGEQQGLPTWRAGRGRARASRRRTLSPVQPGRQVPHRSTRNPNPRYC